MGKSQSWRPTLAPFSTLADENFYKCTYFVLNGESPNMSSPSSLPMVTSGLLKQVIKNTSKYYEFKDKYNVITLKANILINFVRAKNKYIPFSILVYSWIWQWILLFTRVQYFTFVRLVWFFISYSLRNLAGSWTSWLLIKTKY